MPQMPKDTDVMYALTASMTAYARMHKDEMSRIANSIRYADKMPPDFSAVLLKDYMCIDKNYKEKLMTIRICKVASNERMVNEWLCLKARLKGA